MAETGVARILEAYSTDALKAKLDRLDTLLKSVDLRSKQPIPISPFSNRASLKPKHFCIDCCRRLKISKAKRCSSCNMRQVGRNHIATRKSKEAQ